MDDTMKSLQKGDRVKVVRICKKEGVYCNVVLNEIGLTYFHSVIVEKIL